MSFEAFLSPKEIQKLQEQEARSDKAQKRTPEQIEAIYTNGSNVLVSASAGSGKTFVMVERILDKLKRGIHMDQLFISTFTVKAAGELKERIEKKLGEAIVHTQDAALRQHLLAQLSAIEMADIGTMDSFTQNLVTTYGHTIGVAPQFRILQDKNEQDLLKQEVFSELFADYMEGKDRQTFLALVKNFSGNSKTTKPFRQVVDQIYQFSQATSNPKKWLEETLLKGHQQLTDLSSIPASIWHNLASAAFDAADALQDVTELDDYKQVTAKGSPTAAYQKHLAMIAGLRDLANQLDRPSLVHVPTLLQEMTALLPSGTDVTVAGVKYPVFKQVKTQLADWQDIETILAYQGQALPLLRLLQAFVLDFSDQYLERKKQENAYEFSDIAHFAIAILEQEEGIRAAYQDRYHEVMVDEYQDNNHIQERMLDLLSNGHNRFMVGDIKQSIYRFRQADPQIFQSKFEAYQVDPSQGKLILLKENFRSQKEVLDATNAIFTRLMDQEVGQIRYDSTHSLVAGSPRQTIDQPHHQMEYLIYNTDAADEEADHLTVGEVELVAKEIIRLVNEEDVKFSEITLLVPSRTRNEAIVSTFEAHGIPLVSDGGESNYLKSVEVMVMLDTLRTIHNPLQDYALVALLKSPMFAFDEDELARLALQAETGSFYEKVLLAKEGTGLHPELINATLAQKINQFDQTLQEWREAAKLHSLHDLIWKIFNDRFYYDYVGALPNGIKRQANLYALGLRANQFEQTGFKGLPRFIRMIDKVLASENDLADVEVALPQNAVQLMTVHKSKGLEFPYVFLLNMDKNFNAMESKSSLILSRENGVGIQYVADMKERFETPLPHVRVLLNTLPYQLNQQELKIANLSEQMRLLYVALTRAERKLYLVGKGSKEKLDSRYDGKQEDGRLPVSLRQSLTNFQDWVLAIEAAFAGQDLYFKKTFISDEDLTSEKIGRLKQPILLEKDSLKDNRQSEDIRLALDQLESVESLNNRYAAAIALPSLRTPSQMKTLYHSFEEEGMDVMSKELVVPSFDLPDFSGQSPVSGAQIGSVLHELMQRLPLHQPVTAELVAQVLDRMDADEQVKAQIAIDKIVAFFASWLGQEILSHPDKVHREVSFAMLEEEPMAKEQFVLRGIMDGFIVYEDRIILFDYKTDRYKDKNELIHRYKGQMSLYASALRHIYGVEQIEAYLILLGGQEIDVAEVI